MADLFGPGVAVFTGALMLLAGLLVLEIVSLILGGSLIGAEDGPDLDFDAADAADFDLAAEGFEPDLLTEVDLSDFEVDTLAETSAAPDPGPLSWLGLGKAPFAIWLGALLLGFGLPGVLIQTLLPAPLPLWLAVPVVAAIAIYFASRFAAGFAAVLPKTESSAMSNQRLGGRRGHVTVGTARRGSPAEVRVSDHFGNTHYIRAEPVQDDEEIAQGAEVLVLRDRRQKRYKILSLGQDDI